MSRGFRFAAVVLAICAAVALPSAMYAQIPNPGFENWSNGEPVDWITDNIPPLFTFVTQTNSAHSGSSAVEGTVLDVSGTGVSAILTSGADGTGFPVSSRVEALHGFYTFSPSSGDILIVSAFLYKGGNGVGGGVVQLGAAASYTEFAANMYYYTQDVPDTALIEVVVYNEGQNPHPGSVFKLDDLAWGSAVAAVNEGQDQLPTEFSLDQNYPNPFNPTTVIKYQLASAGEVRLAVYDLIGREVALLVNERQEAGTYEIPFNGSNLPSGVYLYRLTSGNQVQTRRMTLIK